MDPAERARRTDAEGRRLLEVATRDPAAAVPTCPGWSAADLVGHMGRVWQAIAAMLTSGATEPVTGREPVDMPADEALRALVAAMATADPAAPVWTWGRDQTMAFYLRRAHNETLVHRMDAEAAAGEPTTVDPDDAIDAVAELFEELVGRGDAPRPTGSLHLHQTDGDGELMLDVVDGTIRVTHEHAKGDAALRATGGELLGVMWRRRGVDGLECFGDTGVVEQWSALAPRRTGPPPPPPHRDRAAWAAARTSTR